MAANRFISTLLSRRWFVLLLAFLGYTLLACIALWPLLAQFNSAVPGGKDTDYYQFLWNYWWIGHALSEGISPVWTDYTLYPHVSNLSIHTVAPIWYPVYALTQPFIGTIASGNLMVLLSFSLTGTAMFAWLRRQLDRFSLAEISQSSPISSPLLAKRGGDLGVGINLALPFLGGLAYAFSPYMLTHAAYIQLNLTPLWWFPVILLLWGEITFPRRLPRPVTTLLLGLCLWGLWLTDLQFIVWLPFAAAGYVLWTLWVNRRDRRWLRLVAWGLLAVAIMFALACIYPLSPLTQVNLSNTDEFPPAGLKTLYAYSMPPEALFGLAPNIETRTLGHILPPLTWLTLLLMVIGWWRARSRRFANSQTARQSDVSSPPPDAMGKGAGGGDTQSFFWLALSLIPITFALGPDITIGGTRVPMPYMLLHVVLGGQHRIPGRLTGVGLFLLITFLVLAWGRLLISTSRTRISLPLPLRWGWGVGIAAVLAILILYDVGALSPFPTRAIPDYAIHHQIAREGGDYVILDVPVGTQYGWTGIGRGYFSMYYGTVHHHRMVNGWLARIPYSTLVYYMNSPLFSWLADTRDPDPMEQQAAADQLARFTREWPVGYIIAYRDWIDPYKQTRWIGWLNMQPGYCPADSTDTADLIWWRNATLGCTPAITGEIDMGTPGDWRFIGDGWYDHETVGGPLGRWSSRDSVLRLTLDPDTAYQLTFTALAFDTGRTVSFSGSAQSFTEPIPLSDSNWSDYTVTIPAGALPDGLLYLRHNGAVSALERGLSEDTRPLAAAYTRFTLRPLD